MSERADTDEPKGEIQRETEGLEALLCCNCHERVAANVGLYRLALASACEPCREDQAQYPLPFDAHAEAPR